jgi:hypothetical protein
MTAHGGGPTSTPTELQNMGPRGGTDLPPRNRGTVVCTVTYLLWQRNATPGRPPAAHPGASAEYRGNVFP